MRWSDIVASSLASLRQRPFRTSLTVLGVVIGTTAVVVMVSLGVGMSQSYLDSVESNVNLRNVTVYGVPVDAAQQGLPTQLDDAMATRLESWPGVGLVAPIYRVDLVATVGRATSWMQITGLPLEALKEQGLELDYGELPTRGSALQVVVGNAVGDQFFNESTGEMVEVDLTTETIFATVDPWYETELAPGREPTPSRRFVLPVSGVIASGGQDWGPEAMSVYGELDALIEALEKALPGRALPQQPATADGKPKPGFVYSEIRLIAEDTDSVEPLLSELRDAGFDAYAEIEWIKEWQQQAVLIQAVFGGIGFISLLVAAIGIANTMLMSVYERTREIGVMKVLGASLSDIRGMFIVESALLGMLGGLAGLVFSLGLSALVNATFGAQMGEGARLSVIPLWLMVGSVAFSTTIGTLAGLAPAQRAVRLSALDAIRSQ
ncbi:MAG TPA: ABC transporter permease [Arachnia sp.]|nr:ABC transporter permease [Arachnia sp.]HMT85697.1 ABC transporter permease [Arachnia sp.]